MDIEILKGELLVSETPGIKTTDPRFDEIATLVQEGHYIDGAKLSEQIIVEKVYDIRLICYFLYGYWLEEGLTSLGEVINTLDNIVLNNWEAIGPVKRREQNIQNSLGWIFRQLLKKIQYEETKNTVLWQQWQESISADDVNKILQASELFRLNTTQQLEETSEPVVVSSKIDNWFKALQRLVYNRTDKDDVDIEIEKTEADTSIVKTIPDSTFNIQNAPSQSASIDGSYHMDLLLKKLSAFQYLLEEEKFSRAALVADDINETLENFDPILYFPKIFESFIKLQALSFEELSAYEEERESRQWEMMKNWLKTDIDSFTNN